MLRFQEIRAQAWLGSWLQVLPAVRALGGPGVASRAVVEEGTHDGLLGRGGRYAALWTRQQAEAVAA